MKIFIVEESTWDHHDNIKVFASEEAANEFCRANYDANSDGGWSKWGYYYSVVEYEVDATITS